MKPPAIMLQAIAMAHLLDSDPIMARQIKEHISVPRLLELLEIDEATAMQAFHIPRPEDN